jgi:hypothetical protein
MPKTQDVTKVQFQGQTEALNVNLNRATINALVDAFAEDSKDGMNRHRKGQRRRQECLRSS